MHSLTHSPKITPMRELTAIVPVSRMAGRLENFNKWLPSVLELGITVVIVHDKQDSETGPELRNSINSINSENIIFLEETFNSPGLARNAGLDICNSEWVCFWDSDDIVHSQSIFRTLNDPNKEFDVLCGQYEEISHFSKSTLRITNNVSQLMKAPGIWRLVIKRDSIGEVRFRNFSMAEDQIFLWEMGLYNLDIEFSKELFYGYQKGSPLQATSDQRKINSILDVVNFLLTERIPANLNHRNYLVRRLCLTLIKRGSIEKKFPAFFKLAQSFSILRKIKF